MRIWSILLITSESKWCIQISRSLFSYYIHIFSKCCRKTYNQPIQNVSKLFLLPGNWILNELTLIPSHLLTPARSCCRPKKTYNIQLQCPMGTDNDQSTYQLITQSFQWVWSLGPMKPCKPHQLGASSYVLQLIILTLSAIVL